MALVVEDGTGVEGANSYSELVALRAYAADRGVVLSADDAVLTPMAIKATDYIETFSEDFLGLPTDADQALSFPRSGLFKSDGTVFPDDEIPQGIKDAQAQLVLAQNDDIDIMPSMNANDAKFVIRKKVDVLETQYSDKFGQQFDPILPAVDSLLNKFLKVTPTLKAIRV